MRVSSHLGQVSAASLAMAMLLSACVSSDLPGTSAAEIATIVAATQRAAPSNTPPPTITPTLASPPTLTSTPAVGTAVAPIRIDLSGGATSARVDGQIGAGETVAYVLRGAQGQPFLASLTSEAGDATLIMMSEGGTYFLRPGRGTAWRGSLPQAGDYLFSVYGGALPTAYALELQLATRIRFKEGQDAITLAGSTPRGTVATYSLFGVKGDKVTVVLSRVGERAALGISGFIDETAYLDIEKHETYFEDVLPRTQDYIIEIVPLPGEEVDYILDIKFE